VRLDRLSETAPAKKTDPNTAKNSGFMDINSRGAGKQKANSLYMKLWMLAARRMPSQHVSSGTAMTRLVE
jgi:hypothetical protein